jgi:hypothetical protein
MSLLIRNARIVEPGKTISKGDVLVHGGRIVASGTIGATVNDAQIIEAGGRLLTPGLIDVHTHGIKHSLYENGVAGLRSAAKSLGQFGVTTVLPTLIPKITDAWFQMVGEIAATLPSIKEVNIPGLHIEGPFMAVGGAACPTCPATSACSTRSSPRAAGLHRRDVAQPRRPAHRARDPPPAGTRHRGVPHPHAQANVEDTEAALEAGARACDALLRRVLRTGGNRAGRAPGRRGRGDPGRPARERGFHRRRRARAPDGDPRRGGRQGLAGV